jgi:hypothetical protein
MQLYFPTSESAIECGLVFGSSFRVAVRPKCDALRSKFPADPRAWRGGKVYIVRAMFSNVLV